MEKENTSRHWYLDILRILAMAGVVLSHVSPQGYLGVDVNSAAWKVMNVITAFSEWEVPVFFMISGALYLDPGKEITVGKLYKKTILRMAASFLAWSSVYALVYCIAYGKGKWTFVNQLIRGHYHMWFIFVIIALYWATPVLRQITASRRTTEYLLGAGLILTFLLPRTLSFLQLFSLPHADVFGSLQSVVSQINPFKSLTAVFYFILGHYLHTYPLAKWMRRAIEAATVLGICSTLQLTAWHSRILNETSASFVGHDTLSTLAASAGVFVSAKYALEGYFVPGRRARRVIGELSACSYGVYLGHALVIERFADIYSVSAPVLLAQMLGVTAAGIAVSCFAAALLRRVPVLGRYIV